jgi:hypothetical protein
MSQGDLVFIKNRHLSQLSRLWKVAIYWKEGDAYDDITAWEWYDKDDHHIDSEEANEIWNALPAPTREAICEVFEYSNPYEHAPELEEELVEECWDDGGRAKTITALLHIVREYYINSEEVLIKQLDLITDNKTESFLHAIYYSGFYDCDDRFNSDGGDIGGYSDIKYYFDEREGEDGYVMGVLDQLIERSGVGVPLLDIIEASLSYWQFKELLTYWGKENLVFRLSDAVKEATWKRSNRHGDPNYGQEPIVYNYDDVLGILRSTDPVLHQYLVTLSTKQESSPAALVSTLLG